MKQNTIFPNLIQKLISDEEFCLILKEVGYHDTARKLHVRTFVQYLVSAAVNEWKSFRHCADVAGSCGLPKVNHSALSKKAGRLSFQIMKELFNLIVSKCNRVTRRALGIPKTLLLVDSTTITVGKTRLPWAVYHGERSGVKLHVSYSPETEMPVKIVESTGLKHDGPVGEQLADSRFVLVEDRAYFKIARIDQFMIDQQFFVIRIKENVEMFRPHSLKRMVSETSNVVRDITCQLGTPQSRSTKRHRVVFFTDDQGNEIRVVTNLMNVSAEEVASMYKTRWKIETFFRWIKQNINVPVLFGTTENAVYNQLFAALIAYVMLRWLFNQTAKKRVFHKLSFVSFQRQLLTGELPIDWVSEMASCLKDYANCNGIGLSKFG